MREQYGVYLAAAERAIGRVCDEMRFEPPILGESMRYTLLSGGKRIRPVLFYAVLDAYGYPYEEEWEFASALECIHSYSLIHDDLPAMDNDDLRRGKPTNHKVFGEGNAVLAGDGLLSFAFELLLRHEDLRHLEAARCLAHAAGAEGMVAGQSADLFYEGKQAGEKELLFIYKNKTARLITAPAVSAAILADGDRVAMETFGEALGILFQLTDDLLDETGTADAVGKTLGKDRAEDKLTCVKLFGVQGSLKLADEYENRALEALKTVKERAFLEELVRFVRRRNA